MRALFSVTYSQVDADNDSGDADRAGYCEEGCSLRDAIRAAVDNVGDFSGQKFDCSDAQKYARVFDMFFSPDYFRGRDYFETRAIHFPANISASSRSRVVRYLKNCDPWRVRGKL